MRTDLVTNQLNLFNLFYVEGDIELKLILRIVTGKIY